MYGCYDDITTHLEQQEHEQEYIQDEHTQYESPQSRVWSHKRTVGHVDHPDENKHNHHGHHPTLEVEHCVIGRLIKQSHIDEPQADEDTCTDSVGLPAAE